ncbi:MAG: hypothetical protein VX620_15555 [Pseudomonadota bacterium]|nr:hypothetical protein [Pseudomonadota bacterium]
MAQHDYVAANGSGAVVRGDFNDALLAVATMNSGATAPSVTYSYMLYVNTSDGHLYQRNAANTAWIDHGLASSRVLRAEDIGTGVGDVPDASTVLPLSGGSLTGGVTLAGGDLGTLTTDITLSISNGNVQQAVLGADGLTITAPNDADYGDIDLELTIDGTGGYSLTLSGFNNVDGDAVDTAAGVVNYLSVQKRPTHTKIYIEQAV